MNIHEFTTKVNNGIKDTHSKALRMKETTQEQGKQGCQTPPLHNCTVPFLYTFIFQEHCLNQHSSNFFYSDLIFYWLLLQWQQEVPRFISGTAIGIYQWLAQGMRYLSILIQKVFTT